MGTRPARRIGSWPGGIASSQCGAINFVQRFGGSCDASASPHSLVSMTSMPKRKPAWLSIAALLTACEPHPALPIAVPPAAPPASDDDVIAIVWTARDGRQESLWLDGAKETARREGVIIAASNGLWRWQVEASAPKLTPTLPCDGFQAGDTARDDIATVRRLDESGSKIVAGSRFEGMAGMRSFDHIVRVVSTAGPLVFHLEAMALGACGGMALPLPVRSGVFDIESGRDIPLVTEDTVPPDVRARAIKSCPDCTFDRLAIAYRPEGRVGLLVTFSDQAGMIANSIDVELPRPPPAFARYAQLPSGVVRWMLANPKSEVGGVSVVGRPVLRDVFMKK